MKNENKIKYNIYDKGIALMLLSVWAFLLVFSLVYFLNPYILLEQTEVERKKEAADKVYLGIYHTNQGEFQEALKNYNEALEIYPNYAEAFINLGITYKTFKDYPAAKQYLFKALAADSSLKLNIYNNLYDISVLENRPDSIHKYLNASIESNAYLIEKYMQIGTGYLNKQIFDSALAAYQTALKHRTDIKSQYHDMLVFAYLNYSNIKAYQKDIKALLSSGSLNFDIKRYDEAAFRAALNTDNDLALNYNRIGFCLARLENYEQALEFFKEAIKIDPSYPDALDNIKYVEKILEKK